MLEDMHCLKIISRSGVKIKRKEAISENVPSLANGVKECDFEYGVFFPCSMKPLLKEE